MLTLLTTYATAGLIIVATIVAGCTPAAPVTPPVKATEQQTTVNTTTTTTTTPHTQRPQADIVRIRKKQQQMLTRTPAYAPTPHQPVVIAPKIHSQPQPKLLTRYRVGTGENLFSIAARRRVYNEGLLWPLIYRANRDQIKDPRTIFPGQTLTIPRNISTAEMNTARETAKNSGFFAHPSSGPTQQHTVK